MTLHLWPLLRLKAATDKELIEAYRRVYIETYVRNADGKEIELYDWNGNRVIFRAGAFNHAFSESSDYRFGGGEHDIPFSKKRARCILWIKEVIAATKGHIERRGELRQSKRRRVLIVVEEKYVVVLAMGKKPKELEFISAFIADEQYLARIKGNSSLLEIKNPSLNGD
jgi:hypothetical protein